MNERKQNTSTYPIQFLLVSSSDHVTAVTGATPVVTLSKNGSAFSAASGTVTEIGDGWYSLAGNATDTNTLGELAIHAIATDADPADLKYTIVSYDPFAISNLTEAQVNAQTDQSLLDAGATSTRMAKLDNIDTIKTQTDKIPNTPAAVGDPMTLTADYEAAKTAAKAGDAMALTTAAIASVKNGLATLEDLAGALNGLSSLQTADIENILDARDLTKTKIDAVATESEATTNKEAVLAAIGGIEGSSGSGPYKVTITVTDGTNALQNARVRLNEGINNASGSTNAEGVVELNVGAATWTVMITKDGYDFTPTTLAVSGDTLASYSLTTSGSTIQGENPPKCNCYAYTFDPEGNKVGNITVIFNLIAYTAEPGVYVQTLVEAKSDAAGFLQASLLRNGTYTMACGTREKKEFWVPDAESYELPTYL